MLKTKTNTQSEAKAPGFSAYVVREREGDKPFWTRIGSGWENADGKGISIRLDALPCNGEIVLRVVSEKKE